MPFMDVLSEKGFLLPKSTALLNYRALATSLAEPDARINNLAEAFYLIRNIGVDDRFDDLREVAHRLKLYLHPHDTVADIAARIYLADPQALIRLDRASLYRRRRKFESFSSQDRCRSLAPEQMPADLSGLESELQKWFQSTKRGARCSVVQVDCPSEVRFLVQHGEPYTRK